MPENVTTPPTTETPPAASVDPTKTEVPKVEATPPEKPRESFSARFAALAKKEKGLALKAQDLKSKEERIAAERAEYDSWKQTKARAKLNPLEALEALGVSYDEITQYVLNDKKPTADLHVKAVKDELEAYKRQQEDEKKRAIEEAKTQAEAEKKAAIDRFQTECVDFVKTNAAEFELTAIHDPKAELIMAVVQENFARTQRVLSTKEAAVLVEKYLEDEIQKALATKKFAARVQPQPKEEAPKRPEPAQPRTTLTNGMSATTPSFASAHVEHDRMRRALAAMEAAQKK